MSAFTQRIWLGFGHRRTSVARRTRIGVDDVRQGENSGRMPAVLLISVLCTIAAFVAVYGYFAMYGAHQ